MNIGWPCRAAHLVFDPRMGQKLIATPSDNLLKYSGMSNTVVSQGVAGKSRHLAGYYQGMELGPG